MGRQNVVCVVGTRPEAVKMAPVILELKRRPDRFETVVLATAQHRQMLDQVLERFQIRPDIDLNVMSENQTLTGVACRVMSGLEDRFRSERPSLVLAQGDTTTVMASALACFHERIPFGHIEAGLRTGNLIAPYPEEFNRRVAALVSDYQFAPTRKAADNLLREGIPASRVFVTGNTVIDALMQTLRTTQPPPSPVPAGRPYVLMTCHRREIFGEKIREVFRAVSDFAARHRELSVWYPVHPNPNVRAAVDELLHGHPNIILTPPLDYVAFVHAMNGARLMLSDSGGVQEEAPALGKPVLVLRDVTERPEGVEAGTCVLVGPHYDRILTWLERLVGDEAEYSRIARARNPFGDGRAAGRIVSILMGEPAEPWPI